MNLSLRMISLSGLAVLLFAGLPIDVNATEICKWVDAQGVVHYAESCPDDNQSTLIQIQPPPPQAQVDETVRNAEQPATQTTIRKGRSGSQRSLPISELGPLPGNTTSKYLRTARSGVTLDLQALSGRFAIDLEARSALPAGAYLEARFPDPENPGSHSIVSQNVPGNDGVIMLLSPKSTGFKCRNYQLVVDVYRDSSKTTLLDSHRQTTQSRLDMSGISNRDELLSSMTGSNCPTARMDQKKSVEEWQATCEREREKRIAPQREAAIEQCVKEQDKDPDWCQRYWSDFSNARRQNNLILPRLYDDLPACVAARKARNEAARR